MKKTELAKLIKEIVVNELDEYCSEDTFRVPKSEVANYIATKLTDKLESRQKIETEESVEAKTRLGSMQKEAHMFMQIVFDEAREIALRFDTSGSIIIRLVASGSIQSEDAKLYLNIDVGWSDDPSVKGLDYKPILTEIERQFNFGKDNQPKLLTA